jgi:hypothetical protein
MTKASRARNMALLLLVIILPLTIWIGIDQVKLELARSEVEAEINAALPPGTHLDVAMAYLKKQGYYPNYVDFSNLIDSGRGYDIPVWRSVGRRNINIVGRLNDQKEIAHWTVTADKFALPFP